MTSQPPDQHPCTHRKTKHIVFNGACICCYYDSWCILITQKTQNELTEDELGAGHSPPRGQPPLLYVL